MNPSPIKKRSVLVHGHKTSISMEPEFWLELKRIAKLNAMTMGELVACVDAGRDAGNLSSALRLLVLRWAKNEAGALVDAALLHKLAAVRAATESRDPS